MSPTARRLLLLNRSRWSPLDEGAALRWWVDASDLATITKNGSNAVSAWNSKAAAGIGNLSGTGTEPLWIADGMNGRPCVEFTDEKMLGTFSHTGDATFVGVCTLINGGSSGGRLVALTSSGASDSNATSGWRTLQRSSTNQQVATLLGSTSGGAKDVTYATPFIWTSIADDDPDEIGGEANGATITPVSSSGHTINLAHIALGANIASGALGTTVMHGRFAEGFIFSGRDIARAQRAQGYLAHRYAITLADGHPYKVSPP